MQSFEQKRPHTYFICGRLLFVYCTELEPFSLERKFNSLTDQHYVNMIGKNACQKAFIDLSVSKKTLYY